MEKIDDLVLSQMLLERGLVPPDKLERARTEATRLNKTLAQILVEEKLIGREDIDHLLSEHTVMTVAGASPVSTGRKPGAAPRADEGLPPDVVEMAKKPDYCFEKFILLGLLGRGGAGEVWKAWQRDLRRYVAIKFLESRDDVDLDRFFLEAQTAASLSHPNITALYELNRHEGRYYIVMQFVDGVTLAVNAGKLAMTRVCQFIRDAALAFDYAHKTGIIHRDIKPQNIMVDRGGRIFVMDFGLAKRPKEDRGHTIEGMILGTPAYMSPEQAESKFSQMDRRSDVFSLGATFYSLVTGKPPVSGSTAMERLRQVIAGEVVPARKFNAKIPVEIEAIVAKSMDRDPALRYQSMAAFAEDLRKFLDGEPVTAAGPTIGKALRHTFRRHRTPILAVGVLLLVIGVATATFYAARRGSVDEGALQSKDEELKRKEAEAAAREELDKVRALWVDSERLSMIERTPWAKTTKSAESVIVAASVALQAHPKLTEARLLLARAYALRQDYEAAEKALKEAIERDPLHAHAHRDLGILLHFWAHETDIQREWNGRRGTPAGDELRARSKPALATFLQSAVKKEPYDVALCESASFFAERDWPKAEEAARRAIEINADRWEAHFFRVKTLRRMGRQNDSIVSGELLGRLARNNPIALHAAAAANLGFVPKGDYDMGPACERAKKFVDQLLGVRGDAPAYVMLRGLVHLMRKEYDAALGNADLLVKTAPTRPDGLVLRGMAHLESKNADKALQAIDEGGRAHPNLAVFAVLRGQGLLLQQDAEGALASFVRAIELDPDNLEAHLARGQLRMMMRRIDDALSDFERAAQLDPSTGFLHLNFLVSCERWDDTVTFASKYKVHIPNDPAIYMFMGMAQFQLKRFLDAAEALTVADRLLPSASTILRYRGMSYLGLKEYEKAFRDFQRTVEMFPQDGVSWCHRAVALAGQTKYKEALKSFEEGFKRTPEIRPQFEAAYADLKRRVTD